MYVTRQRGINARVLARLARPQEKGIQFVGLMIATGLGVVLALAIMLVIARNHPSPAALGVGLGALAVLVVGLGYSLVTLIARDDPFALCQGGPVLAGGAISGEFTLISETGALVTDQDVLDKPALVYFGYTFCPAVCPFAAARNGEAVELLSQQGQDVRPVFISIDPARDTPEILAEFTDYMHPEMLGLTGSPEQVRAASQAYRAYFRKQEGGDPQFYGMDHSVFTYLMLPEIGFVTYFGRDVTPADMAASTACFIAAAQAI